MPFNELNFRSFQSIFGIWRDIHAGTLEMNLALVNQLPIGKDYFYGRIEKNDDDDLYSWSLFIYYICSFVW